MTVEWDQKDEVFYNEQLKKFSDGVEELKAQGLSSDDMMKFAIDQMTDKKVASDLTKTYAMMKANKNSASEGLMRMEILTQNGYAQGAHYIGTVKIVALYTGYVVLLSAITACVVYNDGNY